MSRVFWDTNLFVYLIEGQGPRAEAVAALRHRMIERGDELLTSALTLGELLVKPVETGNDELRDRYVQAMEDGVTVLAFGMQAALRFAEIRGDRSVRAPDAIQLACAAAGGTDLFITNDERLSRKNVPGITFIQSLQRTFL